MSKQTASKEKQMSLYFLCFLCSSPPLHRELLLTRNCLSSQLHEHKGMIFSSKLFNQAYIVHGLSHHPSKLWSSFLVSSTFYLFLRLHFYILIDQSSHPRELNFPLTLPYITLKGFLRAIFCFSLL